METHEVVGPRAIGTIPLEPMANSIRVGYVCGEHGYDDRGLHHKHFRGDFIEVEGWGPEADESGTFPAKAQIAAAVAMAGVVE